MKQLKVDLEEISMALESHDFELQHYLDLDTGEVVVVSEECRSILASFYDEHGEESVTENELATWLVDSGTAGWQQALVMDAHRVEAGFGDRFVQIPTLDSSEAYGAMETFSLQVTDRRLANLLSAALRGKGPFRRFKNVLAAHPTWQARWFAFHYQRLREQALDWLASLEIDALPVQRNAQ